MGEKHVGSPSRVRSPLTKTLFSRNGESNVFLDGDGEDDTTRSVVHRTTPVKERVKATSFTRGQLY